MSEYKQYPEYKNSYLEWLDEIPVDWIVRKVENSASFLTGGTPSTSNNDYFDGDLIWVNISDLDNKIVLDSKKKITRAGVENANIPISPKGSLLFSFKLSVGKVAIAGTDLYTNEAIATFAPKEHLDTKFAFYSFPVTLIKSAKKNIYDADLLNAGLIREARFPLPPLGTQHKIVEFLDRETAHINAGIANMDSLVALLIEKRAALIAETVTRGIPGAHTEFKDSGVAWLGEIPAGWKVEKLNKFATLVKRPAIEGQENITAFRNGRVTLRKNVRSTGYTEADKEHGYQSIHEGDLVIHNMDAFAGAIGISDSYGKSTPVYSVCEVKTDAAGMYLAYALRIMAWSGWIASLSRGIRERSTDFRWATASQQFIPIPSREEQERILTYIETETEQIDFAIENAKSLIELMKEKRQTLISDVVTGKIDVTNSIN